MLLGSITCTEIFPLLVLILIAIFLDGRFGSLGLGFEGDSRFLMFEPSNECCSSVGSVEGCSGVRFRGGPCWSGASGGVPEYCSDVACGDICSGVACGDICSGVGCCDVGTDGDCGDACSCGGC